MITSGLLGCKITGQSYTGLWGKSGTASVTGTVRAVWRYGPMLMCAVVDKDGKVYSIEMTGPDTVLTADGVEPTM